MPSYKLTYFNARGLGEMIRLIFAAAGVEYEDCRISIEEFQKLKEGGTLPFGQLPVLEVDGEMLCQSISMFKYIARETGFSPKDSFEIAKADMIVDGIADMMAKGTKAFFEKDEETKKKNFQEFLDNDFATTHAQFEKLLQGSGGKYFAENKELHAAKAL